MNDWGFFGAFVNAFDNNKGADGDTNAAFPKSDAEDMSRGARFIPGEVTLARRAGQKVQFVQTCSGACCWYWKMPDGGRHYHFDPITFDQLKDNGSCTKCGNEQIRGGSLSAEETEKLQEKASGEYSSRYDEAIAQTPNTMTLAGESTHTLLSAEDASQRAVAESEKWLIARKVSGYGLDSRTLLTSMGFTIIGEHDDLFLEVMPPAGWTKSTEGYWTTVFDETGKEKLSQFYKGAIYDRDAFVRES